VGVPPAMREDRGEIEAAAQGQIPSLVRENDLKGDLHTHTDLTDGVASLEAMVAAAQRRGYEYYAITDHAPNLIMQRMTDEKMLAQRDRVRALDSSLELLHGTELNIGPDGSVDWDAAGLGGQGLAGFDLCVASVHSHFEQPRAEMTRRFIAACENPHVNVIGHPTARRIGKRPSAGRVVAAYYLAVLLFIVTLGIGYLAWGVATWGGGQTPAQKLLGLRCWRAETRRPASRGQMALRQVSGLLLNGEALLGVFILLISQDRTSIGDYLIDTVVLHDPDNVLLKQGLG
jgi:uncharacterized RDD family membrane protein YckC